MGWTWEVEAYRKSDKAGYRYHYEWVPVYQGESFWSAIRVARKEKRYMRGAVRITWR